MAGTVQGLPSCIFAPILQDKAAAPPVCVRIIVCNTHGNAFSCKFSCISGICGGFPWFLVSSGSSRRWRPPSAGWAARRAGAVVCPLFGPEHRPPGDSSPLPSPPLFSSGQCSPLVVSVLLRCSPASGVPLGFLVLVSAPLGMVVYGGIFFFIQPRPE